MVIVVLVRLNIFVSHHGLNYKKNVDVVDEETFMTLSTPTSMKIVMYFHTK